MVPLKTAVACLPTAFRAIVSPRAAASSSTLGFALTVTRILLTWAMRFRMSSIGGFDDIGAGDPGSGPICD